MNVKIRHIFQSIGCISEKNNKKGRLPEVTGLDIYLCLSSLSLDGQRARSHTGCSLYSYHVNTDGVTGR